MFAKGRLCRARRWPFERPAYTQGPDTPACRHPKNQPMPASMPKDPIASFRRLLDKVEGEPCADF